MIEREDRVGGRGRCEDLCDKEEDGIREIGRYGGIGEVDKRQVRSF